MRQPVLLAALLLAALAAAPTRAAADDEDDAKRAAVVDRLLDVNVGDSGVTWSAFYEICGEECEYVGYGGCKLDAGAVDCEVRVYDVTTRKTKVVTVVEADRQPDALAKARAQLTGALDLVGYSPIWLDEHLFATPAVPVTTQNVGFRWDWKKKALTVLDGTKKQRAVKTPRLRKGLGVSSVAIWYHLEADRSSPLGLLRVHGEGEEGEVGDAVAVVPVPGLDSP